MFMFGGRNTTDYLNELWMLNASSLKWTDLTVGSGPTPRGTMGMALYSDR